MLKYIQKNRLCIVMILSSVIYFLFVYSVSAVELYFGSTNSEQSINNKFAVGFFVDTKGESINAVEGKVVFNSDELELVDIIDGESIINFWLNKPEAICNSICEVSFGGVIPGGFVGDKGNIFLLVLRSTKLGEVSISSIDSRILLNNGEGTMADLIISPINFKILEKTDTSEFVYPYDIDPPESFLPTIAQEEDIFDGKFFLAFATQDKLSGMDHYEVAESSKEVSDYNKLKWKITDSPYILKNQSLTEYIYVKAVDKSGNARIQIIPPINKVIFYKKYTMYGILIVVSIILYTLQRVLWRIKR